MAESSLPYWLSENGFLAGTKVEFDDLISDQNILKIGTPQTYID